MNPHKKRFGFQGSYSCFQQYWPSETCCFLRARGSLRCAQWHTWTFDFLRKSTGPIPLTWIEIFFQSKFRFLRIRILEIPYNFLDRWRMNVDRTSYFFVLNRECDTSSSFISSERGCVNPLNSTCFKAEMPPTLANADTTMNYKFSL